MARIVRINAAYELLSDPQQRARYDNAACVITETYEEDPIEVYKREFQRRRWEQEQKKKEQRAEWQR